MTKPIESLSPTDSAAFRQAIEPHVSAITTKRFGARASVPAAPYNADPSGALDATDEIEAAVASGIKEVDAPPGSYRLSRRIVVPDGVNIKGYRTQLLLDVTGFNATSGDPYAVNACPFLFDGNTSGGIEGFDFVPSAYGAENIVCGVAVRSSSNIHVKHNRFTGFSKTKIVRVDSSANCSLEDNEFADCLLSSSGTAQLTCIDIDDNRVAEAPSSGIKIRRNTFTNILVSPSFLSAHGFQTDAINVSIDVSEGHTITQNVINGVGEGIDCFGGDCEIADNSIQAAYNFGIKLIHGARRCDVRRNRITRPGLGGILLSGSAATPYDIKDNTIADNVIRGVNADGHWNGFNTFGIKLDDDGGARKCVDNLLQMNRILEGTAMTWGIIHADRSTGTIIDRNYIPRYVDGKLLVASTSTLGSYAW